MNNLITLHKYFDFIEQLSKNNENVNTFFYFKLLKYSYFK